MDENELIKVPLWFFNFLACPINQLAGVESKQLEEELEKKVYENCNETLFWRGRRWEEKKLKRYKNSQKNR